MNSNFKIAFQFILLVLVQVLLMNKIRLFGYINPIIYIIFIFTYPLQKEKGNFLFLSFLLGLCVDFFSNSGGSNAAATLFIAFLRLPILKLIEGNNEIDFVIFTIKKLNFVQSFLYLFSLTFLHHFVLFFLEYYKVQGVLSILSTTLQTTIFSVILIGFILQLTVKTNIHE